MQSLRKQASHAQHEHNHQLVGVFKCGHPAGCQVRPDVLAGLGQRGLHTAYFKAFFLVYLGHAFRAMVALHQNGTFKHHSRRT